MKTIPLNDSAAFAKTRLAKNQRILTGHAVRRLTAVVIILALLSPLGSQLSLAKSEPKTEAKPAHSARNLPPGLSAGEFASIQAAYEANRHGFEVRADGKGHVARNHGLGWRLEFDGAGFGAQPDAGDWQWGLDLRAASIGAHDLLLSDGGGKVEAASSRLSKAADKRRDAASTLQVNRLSYQRSELLEEWFVNDQRGLEQGWTIVQKPEGAGDEPIRIELKVRGGLQASGTGGGVSFANQQGAVVLTYGGLKAWDAKGKVLEAQMTGEGDKVRIEVEQKDAVYPITIDPVAQAAYLKAFNSEEYDNFGWSVAISGDTVVVGATGEDSGASGVNGNQSNNSASESGAAYVFVRNGGAWAQQAYLKASNPGANDRFGFSVAISGDKVVVGAIGESSAANGVNSAIWSGAAYVFVRKEMIWKQEAYLKASNTDAGDEFGHSVAISGDTVVVGAVWEKSAATGVNGNQNDNSAGDSGAAYVFVRTKTRWKQQAYLKASNTDVSDSFGRSVTISGDTVVVGAFGEDGSATGVNGDQDNNASSNSGAAYVFVRSGGKWKQQAYLKASNTDAGDEFGHSVAISGDTVVVGAMREFSAATGVNGNQSDNGAYNSGAGYVFVRRADAWTQQAYLKASNTDVSDYFGRSVTISGDTVVVGAWGESSAATDVNGNQNNNSAFGSGAAYVFVRKGDAWMQQAYLKASNTDTDDYFGHSVTISGDTVVVGALWESSAAAVVNGNQSDNSAPGSGAAYLFNTGATLIPLAQTGAPSGTANLNFALPVEAVTGHGNSLFTYQLGGSASKGGRNKGIFFNKRELPFTQLLGQSGVAVLSGAPADSKVTAWSRISLNPWHDMPAVPVGALTSSSIGLLQATLKGPGLGVSGSQAVVGMRQVFLHQPAGNYVFQYSHLGGILRRTGAPLGLTGAPEAVAWKWLEMIDCQAHNRNVVGLAYTLKRGPGGVNKGNDSGLLVLNHAGGVVSDVEREGMTYASPFGTVKLGQFSGRIAQGWESGSPAHFQAAVRLEAEKGSRQGVGSVQEGGIPWIEAMTGKPIADGSEVVWKSFSAVGTYITNGGSRPLVKAVVKGPGIHSSNNEGLYAPVFGPYSHVLRKGQELNLGGMDGDVTISRIVKFWAINTNGSYGMVVAQVKLKRGAGVNSGNDQLLLGIDLAVGDGAKFKLLRTGDPAPCVPFGKIRGFQAVDVSPSGPYTVLASVKGVSAASNQVLLVGNTLELWHEARKPQARVVKGGYYPAGRVKSIALKPVVETTGAGGRGLGQVVDSWSRVPVRITWGDKRKTLTRVEP